MNILFVELFNNRVVKYFLCSVFFPIQIISTMDLNITVKSSLPIGEPQGDFPVFAPETMTIGTLLRRVCKDNGIRMKSSYTLRNSSQQELRWSSTLRESLVMSGAVLFLHDNGNRIGFMALIDTQYSNSLFFDTIYFQHKISTPYNTKGYCL